MSTVAFDTLKFVKTLEAGGIDAKQAEAIAAAYRDATDDQQLVTKTDLELTLQKELAPIKAEMQLMKWMLTVVLGGIMVLILKSFF
ncbi:MAG: DUF1640 domain-containing protein [Ignavibacteria bacterium]|nr:DUF1640 domain-containing protein [Ignavibacteria bacterium]